MYIVHKYKCANLQDPWESELVEVKDSHLDQAGQGLFAR